MNNNTIFQIKCNEAREAEAYSNRRATSNDDTVKNGNGYKIPGSAKAYYAWKVFSKTQKNIILTYSDEESANLGYQQLRFYSDLSPDVIYLPTLDTNPYDRTSPSPQNLALRVEALVLISSSKSGKIIVTSSENLLQKLPPPKILQNSTLKIQQKDEYDIASITEFLVENGFSRTASAVDSSEFAVRGEILDVVTTQNQGYRINFAWDKIENIRTYDPYSQISNQTVEQLTLSSANETLLNNKTIEIFKRKFIATFGANHVSSNLYQSIIAGIKFHGYEHLTPLFYEQMYNLDEYLADPIIIYDNFTLQSMMEFEQLYHDIYQSRIEENKDNLESLYYAIKPDLLISSYESIKNKLQQNGQNICLDQLPYDQNHLTPIASITANARINKKTEIEELLDVIAQHRQKIAVILCNSNASKERIKTLIANYHYSFNEIELFTNAKKNLINITICPLVSGFVSDEYLIISEQDILGNQFIARPAKSSKQKLMNILTELDNISEGELVVHTEHGVGRFEKIETMNVEGIDHDCIKISYANNDILYLPVENINQFKKYGVDDAPLDKLGNLGWQKRKARLKNRIRDIAKQLMEITAKRELTRVAEVHFEKNKYEEFCRNFLYSETKDQLSAIEDITSDLESGRLMDRLICGDVGFGKTEVAMRAAFMITHDINEDSPQVAIISPTTILCKQHYKNFKSRFAQMNIRINQLSRLVNPSEARNVKAGLADGSIQIIVGTHALLATNIKFKNLKMIIIDEEQHFGVAQKERLKQIKNEVHVLSLSATPIPRTLQMSMVGIKDLSLITTPPIDRLPVRTNILPYDAVIIRDALMRERLRGGLSFYVAPRIEDLTWIQEQLNKIVPELKYKTAHGQMKPSDIDNIMNEFCDGEFDVLLSTSIIESGIDIPIANTMIIHRADMFGLGQLYQLRGRVGRSKVRGHAYLTLNKKKISKHSMQRLEILRNLDTLGAGFSIASHDMDLRGFGNLVGDEQSGHIREVGAELYQEMLDEAISELKNSKEKIIEFTPKINLKIPILIPEEYISDSALRLAIYRRAGALSSQEEVDDFIIEMEDRFGPVPEEFSNLLKTVEIRNICLKLKIQSLDSGPSGFVVKFNNNFDVADMVMKFIAEHPRHAKIKADNKMVFICSLTEKNLIVETMKFLHKFTI